MTKTYLKNPDLVWRDEPGERDSIIDALDNEQDVSDRGWVLLVDGGNMHQLNLLAGDIWMLCDGSRSAGDIAQELSLTYDAEPNEIRPDVDEFIKRCVENGWLQEATK